MHRSIAGHIPRSRMPGGAQHHGSARLTDGYLNPPVNTRKSLGMDYHIVYYYNYGALPLFLETIFENL